MHSQRQIISTLICRDGVGCWPREPSAWLLVGQAFRRLLRLASWLRGPAVHSDISSTWLTRARRAARSSSATAAHNPTLSHLGLGLRLMISLRSSALCVRNSSLVTDRLSSHRASGAWSKHRSDRLREPQSRFVCHSDKWPFTHRGRARNGGIDAVSTMRSAIWIRVKKVRIHGRRD